MKSQFFLLVTRRNTGEILFLYICFRMKMDKYVNYKDGSQPGTSKPKQLPCPLKGPS